MVRPETRIIVTPACNLNCYYCYHQGKEAIGPYENISLAQVRDIAKVSNKLGISHVHLTGGDPSLRKDLHEIISTIKQSGIEDVAISSNAVTFTRKYVDKLIKAGLDELHFHLPSLDKKSYYRITGRKDVSPQQIAELAAYTSEHIPARFNVPVSERNRDNVHELLDYSLDKSINVGLILIAPPPGHDDGFEVVSYDRIKKLFLKWSGDKKTSKINQEKEYGEFYKVDGMSIQLIPSPARLVDDLEDDFKLSNRVCVGANKDDLLLSFGVDHGPFKIKDCDGLELLMRIKYANID